MKSIRTKVVHSKSNLSWNVIGTIPGQKFKIARVPYGVVEGNEILSTRFKYEALEHARFISECFNKEYEKSR